MPTLIKHADGRFVAAGDVFARLADDEAPPAAGGVINFVILIAALSAMNSQLYITTRMMFSLARAGYAPRRFGVLSRRGVPLQALLL